MLPMFDDIFKQMPLPGLEKFSAYPFIKWAGGKRALVPDIVKRLPQNINLYWEPFVGGGAVFFAMFNQINAAMLSDVNGELTLTYNVVKDKPDALIKRLLDHSDEHGDKDYYYRVRGFTNMNDDDVEIAARFIYLNKTCYNGLYRVNKKGQFNVARGSYTNPIICDADGIRKASKALNKATIKSNDFSCAEPGENDFVYCDPPYDGTYTGYTPGGFNINDQRRLRDIAIKWHKLGAKVMLSNADTKLIRDLYNEDPFIIHNVTALRSINSNGKGRGNKPELLITTYETPD